MSLVFMPLSSKKNKKFICKKIIVQIKKVPIFAGS